MTEQVHKLGEVLRAARETKGVDLPRVERETKIRERYLSALERGEYRELPGAVYTKGFLRNYGAYLGLDPEYLIDLYRLETSASAPERPAAPTRPRPIAVRRRRTFVVTPGAVVAAILTIVVGAIIAWLGYEFVNFARTPELRITEPAGDVAAHPDSTITIRGQTAANATITVAGLPENPSATADEAGNFEMTVSLLPGSNEIRLIAQDPVTNRESDEFVRRVTVVTDAGPTTSPSPVVATTTVAQPETDATITGPVTVAGSSQPEAAIAVSATLVTPAEPTFVVRDAGGQPVAIDPSDPPAPDPLSVSADAAGAFTGTLSLRPGTWDVTVTPPTGEAITRRVVVAPPEGLTAALRMAGGSSYMEIEEDGTPVSGVSGAISDDGETIELGATEELRIRAGNAGAVRIAINGISLGVMGANGAVVEWRVTRAPD